MYWWHMLQALLPDTWFMYAARVVPLAARLEGGGGIGIPLTAGGGSGTSSHRICWRTSLPRLVGDGSDVCACMASTLPWVKMPARGLLVVLTEVAVLKLGLLAVTP